MAVRIKIVLDTRKEKNSETFHVKLRVTLDRKSEHYTTIYDLTKNDFGKFAAPRISDSLVELKGKLNSIEVEAIKAAKAISPFSFVAFETDFIKDNPFFVQRKRRKESINIISNAFDLKLYEKRISLLRETHPDIDYISVMFLGYIIKLLEEGKVGSALNYQDAYNSLKNFRGNVRFTDITVGYLK